MSDTELVEGIASLIHEEWVSWSKNIVETEHSISSARRERWRKLWIPYAQLDEKTKEQDRVWARKVLAFVRFAWETATRSQLAKEGSG